MYPNGNFLGFFFFTSLALQLQVGRAKKIQGDEGRAQHLLVDAPNRELAFLHILLLQRQENPL